jgi:hypothetical protein
VLHLQSEAASLPEDELESVGQPVHTSTDEPTAQAPTYFGGDLTGPTSYVVEVCPSANWHAGGVIRASAHAHADKVYQIARVTGLHHGVTYWARARAVTRIGEGETSSPSERGGAVPTKEEEVIARQRDRARQARRQDQFKLAPEL